MLDCRIGSHACSANMQGNPQIHHLMNQGLPGNLEAGHLIICRSQELLQEGRPGTQLRLQPGDELRPASLDPHMHLSGCKA